MVAGPCRGIAHPKARRTRWHDTFPRCFGFQPHGGIKEAGHPEPSPQALSPWHPPQFGRGRNYYHSGSELGGELHDVIDFHPFLVRGHTADLQRPVVGECVRSGITLSLLECLWFSSGPQIRRWQPDQQQQPAGRRWQSVSRGVPSRRVGRAELCFHQQSRPQDERVQSSRFSYS